MTTDSSQLHSRIEEHGNCQRSTLDRMPPVKLYPVSSRHTTQTLMDSDATLDPTSSSPPGHRDFDFFDLLSSALRRRHPLCQIAGIICGALVADYLYERTYDGSLRQRRYALRVLFAVALSLVGVALWCPSCEWRVRAGHQAAMLPPMALAIVSPRGYHQVPSLSTSSLFSNSYAWRSTCTLRLSLLRFSFRRCLSYHTGCGSARYHSARPVFGLNTECESARRHFGNRPIDARSTTIATIVRFATRWEREKYDMAPEGVKSRPSNW